MAGHPEKNFAYRAERGVGGVPPERPATKKTVITMEILDSIGGERSFVALIKIDELHYICRVDLNKNQVYSYLPEDKPDGGDCWVARYSESGVRYVCTSGNTNPERFEEIKKRFV